jgi:hypothetical protein
MVVSAPELEINKAGWVTKLASVKRLESRRGSKQTQEFWRETKTLERPELWLKIDILELLKDSEHYTLSHRAERENTRLSTEDCKRSVNQCKRRLNNSVTQVSWLLHRHLGFPPGTFARTEKHHS